MRACDLLRKRALGAAEWAGRQGIATEATTGDESRAAHWYGAAHLLASSVAGAAERAYERARGVTP